MKLIVLEVADKAMFRNILKVAGITQGVLGRIVKLSSRLFVKHINITRFVGPPDDIVTLLYNSLNTKDLNIIISGGKLETDLERFRFMSNDVPEEMLARRVKDLIDIMRYNMDSDARLPFFNDLDQFIEEMTIKYATQDNER